MKLDTEFYKLPLQFDAARLAAEARQFTEAEWRAHPQGHAGNSAVPLIAVGGNPLDDTVRGPMRPTPHLLRCPYIQQVLASFGTVLGRARLMRIAGEADATEHVDTNYYWLTHVRVHIPAITWPEVRFLCNKKSVHMAAGESWIFDSWRLHNVINPVTQARIHLVADTAGSAPFWDLVDQAERPFDPRPGAAPPRTIAYVPGHPVELTYESANFPVVMPPWEQESLAGRMLADVRQNPANDRAVIADLERLLARFHRVWQDLWSHHGDAASGWPAYKHELDALAPRLAAFAGKLILPNSLDAVEALMQAIVRPALNTDLAGNAVGQTFLSASPPPPSVVFDRPVFIVSAPRSGSTLLFETLARSPGFVTVGGESHAIIEGLPRLTPAQRGFDSNRLTETDATPATAAALRSSFQAALPGANAGPVRMLEKTPKNALRIPFLNAVFPDALFIFLYREPDETIGSIIDAWNSGGFVTYPDLPAWPGAPWSLLLIPGWRELAGRSVAEIAAAQWSSANQHILDDLQRLPGERWCAIRYSDFLANPRQHIERLCRFAGVAWTEALDAPLPLARHTLTPPEPEKWRRHAALIEPLLPTVEPVAARAVEILAQYSAAPVPGEAHDPAASPLRSVFTTSLLPLINELGISLLVSTYQAGKLIVVRAVNGQLNTHFRNFVSPMGLAGDGSRLAVGARGQVWEFFNQADVARKLQPPGHDAAFMPRRVHFTGDIQVHDIAYAGDELWVVNTRFSCLCTLDRTHSFVPRWTPNFVTALSPEDRCHLNGLALQNGAPRFVTALGRSDKPAGWRENKAFGGVLIDVTSHAVVAAGLSMPHSPRWYADRLWVLESGRGTLAYVELQTGRVITVAEMPGFTRGLDFAGPYAFIGLSQIRESAVFSGLPLTERYTQAQRACGVWVVDIRTGQTVAFLKFSDAVQEIFAVQALQGIRLPDILNEDPELVENSFVLP